MPYAAKIPSGGNVHKKSSLLRETTYGTAIVPSFATGLTLLAGSPADVEMATTTQNGRSDLPLPAVVETAFYTRLMAEKR